MWKTQGKSQHRNANRPLRFLRRRTQLRLGQRQVGDVAEERPPNRFAALWYRPDQGTIGRLLQSWALPQIESYRQQQRPTSTESDMNSCRWLCCGNTSLLPNVALTKATFSIFPRRQLVN